MLSLQAPMYLLLLIPCAVLALFIGRQLAGQLATSRKRTIVLTLRSAALVLLILALSQPVWTRSAGAQSSLTLAVDTSASITAAARTSEITWLTELLHTVPADAARQLVTFGGIPRLSAIPTSADRQWLQERLNASTTPGAKDIESALRVALGVTPDNGRVVLLTDGLQTTGDVRSLFPTAAARHIRVDVVVPAGQGGADAAVSRLQTPAAMHAGSVVPVQVTIWSNRAGAATLSLSQDGRPLGESSVTLRSGDNVFFVNLRAQTVGWHAFHALVRMRGDTVSQNDALDSATRVVDRPHVLVVTQNVRGSAVAALLSTLGLGAQVSSPGRLPATAAAVESYDAVVLEDLPATVLNPRQVAGLEQAVRTKGVGLFVVGGPHSLTLGHYSQTGLERLLPIMSDTPKSLQQGNVTLQLVLDHSGSMNDLAGDVPKIDMARAAANIAVDFTLQHKDELGVVSFDIQPHILVPVQKLGPSNVAHVRGTISALVADGGTDIFKALQTGLKQVDTGTAPYRHIILMTDGRGEPANYAPLLDLLKRHQVTLSAIGLGQDADVPLLKYLAARGKGRFYYTNNARDLPHIFAEEARLSAGSARVTGTIGVAIGASSPLIRSLGSGPLPPIHGYPATVLKPGAVLDLMTQVHGRSPDPVLAHWQYGLGRVAVWTPGTATSWAGAWSSPNQLTWDDTVRWLLRGGDEATLAPHLLFGTAAASIIVDTFQNTGTFRDLAQLGATVQEPNGTRVPVVLAQVGPGRYEGPLPDGGAGIYRCTVQQANGSVPSAYALLVVPYSSEYLPRPADQTLLSEVTSATGGRLLGSSAQLGGDHNSAATGDLQLWWPLIVLALLLFMVDITLRQSDWGTLPSPAAAEGA